MKIEQMSRTEWAGRVLAAMMFDGDRQPLGMTKDEGARVFAVAAEQNFQGGYRKTAFIQVDGKGFILTGLGKRREFELDRVRVAVARAVKKAEELGLSELGLLVPDRKGLPGDGLKVVEAAVEGAVLGGYRFLKYRKLKEDEPKPLDSFTLVFGDSKGGRQKAVGGWRKAVEQAQSVAEAVCYVRDLVNEPSSVKAPEQMAQRAKELARPGRITVKVFAKGELEKLGMGGILGVGRGSHNPPCLVHLTYQPKVKPKKTICVVGKGITFDSGGLSLKPAESMETMKDDMAGAAVVFGLFRFLGENDLPVTVHGIAPLAENLPGGGAQKPGDIIRHYNGKTVEVVNTDAEGRLILADALAYGSTLKPDLMIDIATLTGACVIALGDEFSALLGNDQRTIERLIALGKEQGEFFWQLPLVERYKAHMRSKVADLKNIGKPRNAGTIIGGLFLSEFVAPGVKWVHIDIAGTAFISREPAWDYCPVGATGVPLRTIIGLIKDY
ncbi:MAG: leucyl aminopeptidase [candidate division WOR-3 bacterium]